MVGTYTFSLTLISSHYVQSEDYCNSGNIYKGFVKFMPSVSSNLKFIVFCLFLKLNDRD